MDVGDQVTPPSVLKVRTVYHVCKCTEKTGEHSNNFIEGFMFIIRRKLHTNTVSPNAKSGPALSKKGVSVFLHWQHFPLHFVRKVLKIKNRAAG